MHRGKLRLNLACLLTLACAACAGNPSHSPGPVFQPDLPFPVDRVISLTEDIVFGDDAQGLSSGATIDNGALVLPQGTGSPQYAFFVFTMPPSFIPKSVEITFDPTATQNAFVGVANYATQHWNFTGPYNDTVTIPLPGVDGVSPLGNTYIAIVTPDDGKARVEQQRIVEKQGPEANFNSSTQDGQAPLLVNFDASLSIPGESPIVSYAWNFGDGSFDTGMVVDHLFQKPKQYIVLLTVTDADGDRGFTSYAYIPGIINVRGWNLQYIPGGDRTRALKATFVALRLSVTLTNDVSTDVFYTYYAPRTGSSLKRASEAEDWSAPALVSHAPSGADMFDLAEVNGHPALAYREGYNDLKFIRALDPDGQTWPATPVDVGVSGTFTGYDPCLLDVNGAPLMAYQDWMGLDGEGGDLCVTRAIDPDGANWGAPLIVADGKMGNRYGEFPQLAMIGGQPAIAHGYYTSGSSIYYTRAIDANGLVWPASNLAVLDGYLAGRSSLVELGGLPAVGRWSKNGAGQGLFAIAQDADGLTWNPSVVAAGGEEDSMCLIGGKPAFAYRDGAAGDLYYVDATDAMGTAWNPPQLVDSAGDVGKDAQLLEVDGRPTIVYLEDNGDGTFAAKMAVLY